MTKIAIFATALLCAVIVVGRVVEIIRRRGRAFYPWVIIATVLMNLSTRYIHPVAWPVFESHPAFGAGFGLLWVIVAFFGICMVLAETHSKKPPLAIGVATVAVVGGALVGITAAIPYPLGVRPATIPAQQAAVAVWMGGIFLLSTMTLARIILPVKELALYWERILVIIGLFLIALDSGSTTIYYIGSHAQPLAHHPGIIYGTIVALLGWAIAEFKSTSFLLRTAVQSWRLRSIHEVLRRALPDLGAQNESTITRWLRRRIQIEDSLLALNSFHDAVDYKKISARLARFYSDRDMNESLTRIRLPYSSINTKAVKEIVDLQKKVTRPVRHVNVVGNSPAACATVIALHKKGISVSLIPVPTPRINEAHLLLQPAATRAAGELGILKAIEHESTRITHMRKNGRDIPPGARPWPFLYIGAAQLDSVLLAYVQNMGIIPGSPTSDFISDIGKRGVLTVIDDGPHSTFRTIINGDGTRWTPYAEVALLGESLLTGRIGEGVADLRSVGDISVVLVEHAGRTCWTIRGPRHLVSTPFPQLKELLQAGDSSLSGYFDDPADVQLVEVGGIQRVPIWANTDLALIGDAAHPVSAAAAMSEALGFEDAIMLTRALKSNRTSLEAMAAYQASRSRRAEYVAAAGWARSHGDSTYGPDRYLDEELSLDAPLRLSQL